MPSALQNDSFQRYSTHTSKRDGATEEEAISHLLIFLAVRQYNKLGRAIFIVMHFFWTTEAL
jgi:hypothetical protein